MIKLYINQNKHGNKRNKTGSRQCTRAIWYICLNSFYTPWRIDALFAVSKFSPDSSG